MNIDQIVSQLRDERDRLTRAIEALEGRARPSHARAPRAAAKKASGGGITAAGRKRLSELMKKRWAERRKGAKK